MKTPRTRDGSLRRRAYHYIQQQILAGRLPSGAAVSEIALARRIGVSRTPVREAIGQLVAEGLLEQIPGRGAVVIKPNRDDIVELYELREALEVYAVAKAARGHSHPADLTSLYALCDQIHAMAEELRASGRPRLDETQMRRFLCADLEFHTRLLRMAGNQRIMKVVADTRLLTRIFSYRLEGHDAASLQRIEQCHRGVIAAVASGDAVRAMQLLGEHIRVSMQERLESYDRAEREREVNRMIPWSAAQWTDSEPIQAPAKGAG